MLKQLKEKVFRANISLVKHGLVILTWGNASQRDTETGLIVIKPSGLDYDVMMPEHMVVVDINGNIIEGNLKPSSDTESHLEIYRKHPEINGITHTHSRYAVAFSQSGRKLNVYGSTQADYFYGDIPCTRALTKEEIEKDYEQNTGKVINETISKDGLSIPGVLVKNHGPFTFGKNVDEAVYHAVVLEEIANMNFLTEMIDKNTKKIGQHMLDKHYYRKHGKNSYYGQKDDKQ